VLGIIAMIVVLYVLDERAARRQRAKMTPKERAEADEEAAEN
jgi:hypothetical protein